MMGKNYILISKMNKKKGAIIFISVLILFLSSILYHNLSTFNSLYLNLTGNTNEGVKASPMIITTGNF
jgi:hypothetical protein